jgi:hypothetical protein
MIEIVIKIPEDEYNIAKYGQYGNINVDIVRKALANGIPLPKGHGKIIDVNVLLDEMRATRTYDIPFALERIKPIIEADKESDE